LAGRAGADVPPSNSANVNEPACGDLDRSSRYSTTVVDGRSARTPASVVAYACARTEWRDVVSPSGYLLPALPKLPRATLRALALAPKPGSDPAPNHTQHVEPASLHGRPDVLDHPLAEIGQHVERLVDR